MSSSSYRIKLSYEGGSTVLSVEPKMTLQELGEKAQELLDCNTAVTLSSFGSSNGRALQPIEWEGNEALVRDAVPKMSLVQCAVVKNGDEEKKRPSSFGNDSKDKSNEQPPKKKAKIAEIVDLCSDSDDDDDSKNKKLVDQLASSAKGKLAGFDMPKLKTNTALDDPRDPTKVTTEEYWIWQNGAEAYRGEPALGKWLLFYSSTKIKDEWTKIAKAVQSGELHAAQAKVATQYNKQQDPSKGSSHVICVYTSKERQIKVGNQLIQMVQHDLCYKTDEDTLRGKYGSNASSLSLYWNNGHPSTTRTLWTKTESLQRARQAKKSAKDTALVWTPFDKMVVQVNGLQHAFYKHNTQHTPLPPLIAVTLTREPHNDYDSNALRVELCPSDTQQFGVKVGQLQHTKAKVGYVDKKQAQVLAPWMDRQLLQIEHASVQTVKGWESATVLVKGKAHPEARPMLQCFAGKD